MPKAVQVTFEKFLELEKGLKSMGFVEVSRYETVVIIKAFGLQPPRERRRGEVCYKCSFHGYTVKVATSCLRDIVEACRRGELPIDTIVSHPAGEDAGWVLIVDFEGNAQYFARPIFRTKNFVRTLLRRTWITRKRIMDRPLCSGCGKFMDICESQSGGNFWGCYRRKLHPDGKSVFKDWDFNLPSKALRIVKTWRKQFAKYLQAERKKGHEPRRASSIRRPWKATKNPF